MSPILHCTEKTLLQSGYIRRCRAIRGVVKLYPEPIPFGMDSLTRLPYKKETTLQETLIKNIATVRAEGVVGL